MAFRRRGRPMRRKSRVRRRKTTRPIRIGYRF